MNQKKILLIDDDSIHNIITKKFIELFSPTSLVKEFMEVSKSLEYLEQEAKGNFPDYIFVDLRMPVHDGFYFLDQIEILYQKKLKNSNVYVVSSSSLESDIKKSLAYGFVNGFIEKTKLKNSLKKILS